MSTIQSQLNILAAANCGVHKRITELENNQISVKYNEESTEFCMGSETKQIKYLGYKAYDAILSLNSDRYYLMDYTGKYEKIENNTQNIFIHFEFTNEHTGTIQKGEIIFDNNNDTIATILNTELKLTNKKELSSDNIIRYSRNEKYGFIKLKDNSEISSMTVNGIVVPSVNLTNDCIKYESNYSYQNIKFIDLSKPISDDNSWTLPPLN